MNNFHSLESLLIWWAGSDKKILGWDESTWQLIAINRKAGLTELRKEFEKIITNIENKELTKKKKDKLTISAHVRYLRAWDLRRAGYAYKQIKEKIKDYSGISNSNLSHNLEIAVNHINDGYRSII